MIMKMPFWEELLATWERGAWNVILNKIATSQIAYPLRRITPPYHQHSWKLCWMTARMASHNGHEGDLTDFNRKCTCWVKGQFL
jgi:hypothetical protein